MAADALDAVTQPLSDLNLRSKDIPLILDRARHAPYDLDIVATCDGLRKDIADLDEVLGPDADEPEKSEGLINRGLQTGGSLLGGMIPFRGLVRQLSGAKAHEAEWQSAIYAGVARRSFLKGYLIGKGCPTADEAAYEAAQDVLGLAPG